MATFQARHTVDQSGARYVGAGMVDYEGDSLEKAAQIAEEMTTARQCGYVVRMEDQARLMPNGSWS